MPPCLALPNAHVCGERGGVHDAAVVLYGPFGALYLRMWTAVLLRPQLSHSLHARCLLPRENVQIPLTSADLASEGVWWISHAVSSLYLLGNPPREMTDSRTTRAARTGPWRPSACRSASRVCSSKMWRGPRKKKFRTDMTCVWIILITVGARNPYYSRKNPVTLCTAAKSPSYNIMREFAADGAHVGDQHFSTFRPRYVTANRECSTVAPSEATLSSLPGGFVGTSVSTPM